LGVGLRLIGLVEDQSRGPFDQDATGTRDGTNLHMPKECENHAGYEQDKAHDANEYR